MTFRILATLLVLVSIYSFSAASIIIYPTGAWQASTPEEQGMESQALAEMMEYIKKNSFNIDSISVVRNGFIVFDAYFWPFSKGQKHIIHSCTKSIMSALIGIAIDKGYIQDVNQSIIDFFPDKAFANNSDLKKSITLENLLMMASGLKCRDSYLYRWKGLLKCDITGIGLNMFSTFPWLSLQVKSLNIAMESHISYLSLSKIQQK